MKLIFTNHSQARILERNISIEHIKKAIIEPDSRRNAFEGKIQVSKAIGNKVIEVIYYKEEGKGKKEEYRIITAYYLEK